SLECIVFLEILAALHRLEVFSQRHKGAKKNYDILRLCGFARLLLLLVKQTMNFYQTILFQYNKFQKNIP
ncbi:MAG TPA: hypothetical protein VN182_00540, partial [Flavobacterium sp.]|nr:hypothetical protein [Flavobacterium sp.]